MECTTWYCRLSSWGYPSEYIWGLSNALDTLQINPDYFKTPIQLGKYLRKYERTEITTMDIWDDITKFFKWLGEQIWNWISPYAADIVLITIGGVASWFLSGWYKAIGVIPVAYGIYDVYQTVKGG